MVARDLLSILCVEREHVDPLPIENRELSLLRRHETKEAIVREKSKKEGGNERREVKFGPEH